MIESLRLNYTRNISSEKEKREKMFKAHNKYRKKINFNLTNKSFDDNYFDIETELINNNSFKKDELKLIQMYNKKIRDGFLFRKLNK
jgi:preprotein translocase subunit SecB